MRYLNKIVLINSASVKYAEAAIDGNVHFIGTQGVGKSTLLRAILFFYNADTLKLGLTKEKKSFAEYYFPFSNSFVVYEVNTETGFFCVMAFKAQGKVCFRFLDGPYNKDYFISPEGQALDAWDKIRKVLDSRHIYYSRKIDRYEEYRDIIYGNNDGRTDTRKYAIIESRQYRNIPRTIQNVFLNSKLEAEFIKQTIIMSLNEEDITIDLTNYTHHLKDFEPQLQDIKKFREAKTQEQVEQISKLQAAIGYLEKEKQQLAAYLSFALKQAQAAEPVLYKKLDTEQSRKKTVEEKHNGLEQSYLKQRESIQREINILENHLKRAKNKKQEYDSIGIEEIIERVAKKTDREREKQHLLKEKQLLSGQYQETTQKYEALLKEAENQYKAFENTQNSNRIVLKEQFLIDKEKIAGGYKKLIENLRKQQDQERQAAKENLEHKNNLLQELKIRKAGLRHKRLYEAEIENLKSERYTYSAEKDKATNQILHLKEVIETIQKQWETDDKRIQEDFSRSKEKVNEHIARLEAELNEINYKIESSKNSFYSWLNEHMPGWENTIGKVCDEQLLFQDELSPELVSLTESNFYGVKLNLYEINRTVKTVADYEQEKTALTSRIKELQKTITHLQETRHSDGDKLRSKYQPKIIEHKNTIHESTYAIEQYQAKYEETTVRLDDYNRKAETEKQAQLQTVDSQITETAEAAIIAEGTVKRLEDALKRQIKAKETERSNRIETEEETLKTRLSRINAELGKEQAAFDLKKEALLAQLKNELSQQGAEIKRLGEIETLLVTVEEELNYIETNSSKVILYQADKEELFDKIDSFKSQKQLCQRQLQQEEQKHLQKKQELIAAIKSITESITLIEKELQQTKDDFDAFNNFQTTETYKQAVHLIRETDTKDKTEKRCTALIDELQKNYFNGIERLRELEKTVNSFLGNFQSENIFMFSTQLNSEQEYLRFTSELAEFMQENKIAEYAKRVNERYANIITLIGKETSDLISREGKIAKVISDINKDFIERNFAGVIKNIELRLDKSANKVVQLLVEIKKFNDENAHTLGAANLFTDSNQELNNQKATDLLRQLVKAIKEFKSDTLSLSHSFELQFRIVENDNDTGWVEKLANVGSDGTDVLVKAMINIMLLNVFKEGASRRFKDFKLHCMMDEIGKLHPNNVRGILKFANDRNILLINSSPTENDALAYRHIYKLHKDSKSVTVIKRLITQYTPS